MNAALEALMKEVEDVRRALKGSANKQIWAETERERMRGVCSSYFSARGGFGETPETLEADGLFKDLQAMSRSSPSRQKTVDMLAKAKKLLVAVEGTALTSGTKSAGRKTPTDQMIIDTLKEMCPSAAAAYSQALDDLGDEHRESWRGPATDLREALRETLAVLAPDELVMKSPGFKLDKDAHRPTMKQKVKFILKSRGTSGTAMAAPEQAMQGIEDIVGGLTRSVYDRSSMSTHTPTDKKEVVRVHGWVRIILCELLEVPPG